jgi:type I restriction enzyme M protein
MDIGEKLKFMSKNNGNGEKVKSMESWIWDAACSIRGAQDAPKYKDFILPDWLTRMKL